LILFPAVCLKSDSIELIWQMFYDARQTVFVALITYIFSVFTTCGVLFASVVEYDLNPKSEVE